MISSFFIHRPRFAFVISIIITLAGLVSIASLPIAQYPNFTPSLVQVTTTYPGADAQTVLETVIQPIETQINGVKKMLYVSSTATDSGSAIITITFGIGTDGDLNTVNTQNRVNWASAQLPEEVRRQSVIVKEQSPNMLLVFAVHSPNSTHDAVFLSNFASINLKDEFARIPGVGDVQILGELKYSMRVWLDPDKLAYLKMPLEEVTSAIQAQNLQVSAGALGEAPSPKDQVFRLTIQTQGRLRTPEEFAEIVVRSTSASEQVKIKDIGRVELGAENYSSNGNYNGKPAAIIAIYQLNDANGLEIAKKAEAKLEELKAYFPEDVACDIAYDTTAFITASIDEVAETLYIAVLLVILVTFLFLQDWRATLVPTVAIPVSLVGTFAVMLLIGFTINLITLFGLILAIGIVVDDAIVVIENISRLMEEEHLSPKDAALKSMEEVTGPVIATTLVLLAMFVPVCFLPGITGEMYRQFGVTISVAVGISAINALTLSPALSALVLRPNDGKRKKFILFRLWDSLFEKLTRGYLKVAAPVIRHSFLMLLFYAGLLFLCLRLYDSLPTGFIPDEDQGYAFVDVQLPDGASLVRTDEVVKKVTEIGKHNPAFEATLSVTGYSMLTSSVASCNAFVIFKMKPWGERKSRAMLQDAVFDQLTMALAPIHEAKLTVFGLPAISGIGNTNGFSFVIQDTTGTNPQRLQEAVAATIEAAEARPEIAYAYTSFRASVPQVYLKVNREKALKMGVTLDTVNNALQGLTGYTYVNDFNEYGQVYKVELQADSMFRSQVDDVLKYYVRNSRGEMVPLGTIVEVENRFAPQYLNRYDLYASATVSGFNAPGYSSGQAMKAMEEIGRQVLPPGMKFDWTDMSYQEREAAKSFSFFGLKLGSMVLVFALALTFMYLFLVAQYESWMLPAAVLLTVPIAFFGALLGLKVTGIDNNIYTQVGFVLLFGIACKTAILIVEFAKKHRDAGNPIFESAMHAAKLRFRAVLMTAISFLLGVLPLVIASGASSVSRRSLGTAVFGGMLLAVLIGTILIPAFFVAVELTTDKFRKKAPEKKEE